MAAYFLDSSAIVKRYVAESGSAWIVDLMDPARANRLYVASIAGAEVVAALSRRAAAEVGNARRAALLGAIADFPGWISLVGSALWTSLLPSLPWRWISPSDTSFVGYDSVQLAAATQVHGEFLALGASCTLVSADAELNTAAIANGLLVENPNAHPHNSWRRRYVVREPTRPQRKFASSSFATRSALSRISPFTILRLAHSRP